MRKGWLLEVRSKKALYNSLSFLILEFVSIICGFILPKAILSAFGSTYNGLTTSITQFLSVVTLLRAGVGGVTRAALYKPLAENDVDKVSSIVSATMIFMRKIAYIFAAGLIVFAFIYPLLLLESFEYIFTCTLVLIMGIATFLQYYFSITYQMLLIADQRQYITAIIQCLTMIFNLLVAVIMIKLGFGIHAVKIGSAMVYCLNPVLTVLYIKYKYKLRRDVIPDKTALLQRWDAFTHQIAAYIQDNTDIIVLTVFSTVKEVSVYSVYFLLSNGVKKLLSTFTVGVESAFGNMIALNDYEGLRRNIIRIEYLLYSVATITYSCLFILIVPFVSVYTAGITDAEYERPLFALLLAASQFVGCIRTPYQNIVDAAGHFKQTRDSAVIEAVLNLIISVITVIRWGLIGVAIGTLISSLYRTIYLSVYASKCILNRDNNYFIKRVLCSIAEVGLIYVLITTFVDITTTSYMSWFIYAILVGVISSVVVLIVSLLFDRQILNDCLKKILSLFSFCGT